VRKQFKLSPFYKQYLSNRGLPIVSSDRVSPDALREAWDIIDHMLAGRDDIRQELIKRRIRVAVMSPTELTTDIPEHSDLTPKDYWDKRARGLGATFVRPAISCAEENLLNRPGDGYAKESILVHEFAHTMHEIGLAGVDPKFDAKLQAAYKMALERGLWKGTYAATNHKEYWAEGVQSYFDTNRASDAEHNDIDTREKLAKYDPTLFALIDDVYRHSRWRYVRWDTRHPAK
jgi:alpha-glucosidase